MSKSLLHLNFALQRLERRIDGWPLKLRVLALAAGCAIVIALLVLLWWMPILAAKKLAQQQIDKMTMDVSVLQTQYDTKVGRQQKLQAEATLKLADLQKQQLELDKVIDGSIGQFKPVSTSMSVLQSTLSEQVDLQLISMKKLPLQPFKADESDKTKGMLYQQGIQLSFRGNYFATLAFLEALEEKKWPWSWGSLDYQVESYPNAVVQLQLSVFSIGTPGNE